MPNIVSGFQDIGEHLMTLNIKD